jgi:hypothetical protein
MSYLTVAELKKVGPLVQLYAVHGLDGWELIAHQPGRDDGWTLGAARGGPRLFKSLDSLARVLRDAGIASVEVKTPEAP